MQKKLRDDDLFKETTMTFGEHLEELRYCLARAVFGLVLGICIGLLFGKWAIEVIKTPLTNALREYYMTDCELEYEVWMKERQSAGLSVPYTLEAVAKLVREYQHIVQIELVDPRQLRLVLPQEAPSSADGSQPGKSPAEPGAGGAGDDSLASAATTQPSDDESSSTAPPEIKAQFSEIGPQHLQPLLKFWPAKDDPRIDPTTLSAPEAFMFWMKAGLVLGVLISSPWVLWQVWSFVAAGLYSHERRYVYVYFPLSLALFFAGAGLAYFFVFEPVLNFLLGYNRDLGLGPEPRISEWMNFVLFLPIGFGVSFQLPLVMLFLNRLGILGVEVYTANWRIALLAIVLIAAVLTPADPISMLLMAGPLCLLYFFGIGLCKYMPRGRNLLDG